MALPAIVITAATAALALANQKSREFLIKSFVPKPTAKAAISELPRSIPLPEDQKEDETKVYNNTFKQNQYDISINRTYVVNVGTQTKTTLEIPALRLPLEADKGEGTKTTRGKSIDIKKSVYAHEYGKLLHKPITNKKLTVYETVSKNSEKEFKSYQDINLNNIAEYLANRDSENKLLALPKKIEQLSILLMPENLRGFSGAIGLLFGHEPLSILNRQYTSSSTTAYMPLRTNAYTSYKKVKKELTSKTISNDAKAGEEAGLTVTSIGLIWDWLGIDNLYRSQDGQLIIDKLLAKFGNVNLLQKPTDKKSKDKSEYNPKGWRFDSLLEYFTSLIAVAFWKLGLNNLPAEVPKNIAELPTLDEIANEREKDKQARTEGEPNLYFDKGAYDNTPESIDTKLKEKYYQKLYSLGEYQAWTVKQIDAVSGMYPIEIEVADTDLIKVGDQPIKLTFPNASEALAEIVGASIEQTALLNALVEITLRTLQETGSSKTTSSRNYYKLDAILDYLGFKLKKSVKEIQFCYNPTYQSEKNEEEKLDEALKPSTAKIDIEEYDDDNSLEMHLLTLVEAARIIKSSLTRKVDPNNSKALKEFLINSGKVLLEEEIKKRGLSNPDERFKDFLEEVEDGFNATQPYNRVKDRRPRITEKDSKPDAST